MASYTSYNDGDGLKKYRAVRGNGDTTTPYEGYVVDSDLNTATGTQAQSPASKSTLTTTGTTAYSIIQLLKGILLNSGGGTTGQSTASNSQSVVQASDDPLVTATGTQADASSTTGSLMARIRAVCDRIGSYGDAASTTGSIMAQLRAIGDNLAPKYGDGTTQASPNGSLFLAKGTGANAGKVYGAQVDTNGYLQVVQSSQGQKVAASSNSVTIASDDSQFGVIGDTASSTGSLHGQLRYIGESLSGNRTISTSAISISASGNNTVITGTAGKKICISTLVFSVSGGTTSITLKDGTTAISGATSWLDHGQNYAQPIMLTSGNNFVINLSAAANVNGYVVWYLI